MMARFLAVYHLDGPLLFGSHAELVGLYSYGNKWPPFYSKMLTTWAPFFVVHDGL